MLVSLTALYAAILAIVTIALGINVTVHRARLGISLGDDGNPQMRRMIRLHGNAAEYVPLAVVLMLIYEINGGAHLALHIIGVGLVAGRVIQTLGMWSSDTPNLARGAGQTLTWLAVAALAVLNISRIV
ncbi:MAG: uncharacterized protein QOD40_2659 [Alphaproteobacteria bacterium]|jgi:uncharacterized membrane protein YecN with MAPEG domain|nr:uncharacterized protein [Alphaproteobacteria bacterium]